MIEHRTIQIINSWNLAAEIIVEIKHYFKGLHEGLIIKSNATGQDWIVMKRLLFHHIAERQIKFTNEETIFIHSSFATVQEMLKSADDIVDKEEQNIFQYQLRSVGQHLKPKAGDVLVLLSYNNSI